MKRFSLILLFAIIIGILSCQKKDDIPPILTLTGSDKVTLVLNSTYLDAGATATDETDGNINSKIFIDSKVDVNKIGEYTITYHVTDEAGNEAMPLTRWVSVYNQSEVYSDFYNTIEIKLFPNYHLCEYTTQITPDSSQNFGLNLNGFACNFGKHVFAQINDTAVILPYQILEDSLVSFSIQGSGFINDSTISINYTVTINNSVELWNAELNRQNNE